MAHWAIEAGGGAVKMKGHRGLPVSRIIQFAWRNLWRNRRRTLITLCSIALGFGLAVFFIGLSDGGHNSMIRNAIRLGEGHITVQPKGYLEAPSNHKFLAHGNAISEKLDALGIPGQVEGRISLQALASTAHNSAGVQLEGVVTAADHKIDMIKLQITESEEQLAGALRGILIGDGLARKLKARPNSKVVLMAGTKGGDSQAHLARVSGIYDSGLTELDNYLVFADIGFTRLFLAGEGADPETNPLTRFAVYLDDPDMTDYWQGMIQKSLDDDLVQTLSWQQMMPQLVQYIALDDAGNYVFLILILIMVVIGIINTVLMSVLERTREFGLLRALGINRTTLIELVIFETFILSLLAVFAGWLVGGGIHLWFTTHGLDLSKLVGEGTAIAGTYMDPVVYTELSLHRVAQLTLIIFACTMVTGVYPAIKAARVAPVDALRT